MEQESKIPAAAPAAGDNLPVAEPAAGSKLPVAEPAVENKALEVEFFRGWLDVQRQEIETRRDEVSVQKHQIEVGREEKVQAHEYAMAALNAHKEDRIHAREASQRKANVRYWFLGVLAVLILGFASVALYTGRDAIVLKILEYVALVMGGGGAGYAIASRKKATEESDASDESGE